MNEIDLLRDAFGPDEVAPDGARDRARTALLDRIHHTETANRPAHPGRRRWPLRLRLAAAGAAMAAAAVVAVVVVENLGTVDAGGTSHPAVAGLPFAHPASAAEYLENAAWAATRKPWKTPRPDQFMYKESQVLTNDRELQERAPNGPLVPGRSRVVTEQHWNRIDAHVMAYMRDGKLHVDEQHPPETTWGQVPYDELVGLTTAKKVLDWEDGPHPLIGVTLDALLGQYVLPPDVEAAVFRAVAVGDGVRLDSDAVNIDGRPAVGLGKIIEGYLSEELLFDASTYDLIGMREVAVADHTNIGDDGTSYTHKGDLFRQVVYTASRIVDRVGDTG